MAYKASVVQIHMCDFLTPTQIPTVNTTHNSKLSAVKTLLRIRGYKELNEDQMKNVHDLLGTEEISVVEIVDQIENSPAERTARAVRNVRSKASRIFGALSDIAKPASEKK